MSAKQKRIAYRVLLHAEWYLLSRAVSENIVVPHEAPPLQWSDAFDALYLCRVAVANA